jgi:outer membrane protein assembly factor BamA
MTRFLKLTTPSSSSNLAPLTLVLHAKHGNCIGPLGSYDYHVLGGPHSCRGYSLGELGPARSYLETCAELRLPVPLLRTQASVFAENARDLGSPYDLLGAPREVYKRAGRGSALGVGIKLGIMRLELARDCNAGKSTWFVNFGERF